MYMYWHRLNFVLCMHQARTPISCPQHEQASTTAYSLFDGGKWGYPGKVNYCKYGSIYLPLTWSQITLPYLMLPYVVVLDAGSRLYIKIQAGSGHIVFIIASWLY